MNVSTTAERSDGTGQRSPRRIARLATSIALALIMAGCGKGGPGDSATNDAEIEARLTELTTELHHTMAGRKLNRNFDEFVALSKLEVPPPPPGKKYAINEKWKVVLVKQ